MLSALPQHRVNIFATSHSKELDNREKSYKSNVMQFKQLISWQNLLTAYRKTSKGKRGKPNVAAFELF